MNIKELKEMINLMNENGLLEMEVEKDNVKIKLKKQPSGGFIQEVVEPAKPVLVSSQSLNAETSSPPGTPSPAPDEMIIRSPMVGTFYVAPSPEAEPYVTQGKSIKVDDVLCIVEAMKLLNEIKSEVNGTVVAILVKNGQALEYDQPLFRIKKS